MRTLRLGLDLAYKACGVLAAIALAMIAALMLAQIIGRFFNVLVPGVNEAAAFLLAATSFLALAYSFRAGSHIRVSLFLHYLPDGVRRFIDLLGVVLGIGLMAYFSWYTWRLVSDSIRFKEVSDGLLAIPLWIPQAAMLLGLVMLTIALVEEFFHILAGGVPSFDDSEDVVLRGEDDAADHI
ncbi:MAG: TRAP transporter small permease [Alphaproteobacteria bacterium]|nr:TRAP transporter small permease [Alphaproteobacteria bacterium]MDX5368736.1 TRAP transporter small permease [Alphaproteobacteria bacterium]MDX5463478.1 TRAP transporter small permease [Alphaproteobacteria bacterium]